MKKSGENEANVAPERARGVGGGGSRWQQGESKPFVREREEVLQHD